MQNYWIDEDEEMDKSKYMYYGPFEDTLTNCYN